MVCVDLGEKSIKLGAWYDKASSNESILQLILV